MSKHPRIVIVDYGVGNLHSLARAFMKCGIAPVISENPDDIMSADGIVLPGVGSFAAGMKGLEARGLVNAVKKMAAEDAPMLGICLGAQLLLSEGHEFGVHQGLDIIPGRVVPFPQLLEKEKIPHIGWNAIAAPLGRDWRGTVLAEVPIASQVYFVHSYILEPSLPEHALSVTTYGGRVFCSAVQSGNIYGCQFHPEKSGDIGLQIIANFVTISAEEQSFFFPKIR